MAVFAQHPDQGANACGFPRSCIPANHKRTPGLRAAVEPSQSMDEPTLSVRGGVRKMPGHAVDKCFDLVGGFNHEDEGRWRGF